MSTDRLRPTSDFDRIASAWLADGPIELSDRVLDAALREAHLTHQRRRLAGPWRTRLMNRFSSASGRIATALIVAAIAIGGSIYALSRSGGTGGPGGSSTPNVSSSPGATTALVETSPAPRPTFIRSAPPESIPPLTARFTSPRNGYAVVVPASWTAIPASQAWLPGTPNGWGSAVNDELIDPARQVRFMGTSQPLASGQSGAEWVQAYVDRNTPCTGEGPTPEQTLIGGQPGTIDQNGCLSAHDPRSLGGRVYDVVVVVGGRGYNFEMDGQVDHAYLLAVLATITFNPASAVH